MKRLNLRLDFGAHHPDLVLQRGPVLCGSVRLARVVKAGARGNRRAPVGDSSASVSAAQYGPLRVRASSTRRYECSAMTASQHSRRCSL